MIKPVGQAISSAIEASKLRESGKTRAAPAFSPAKAQDSDATPSPTARMAAQGAPVDLNRVAVIKNAIASGNYPVNAKLIAEKMVTLDLPVAG